MSGPSCACACGGVLEAADATLEARGAAARSHAASPRHRAWRRRRLAVAATAEWRRRLAADVAALRLARAADRRARVAAELLGPLP